MANIIVPSRRIWTRQPQQAVEIDQALNLRPVFAYVPGCGPVDLVNKTTLVTNGTPSISATSRGLSLVSQANGVSYSGLRVPETVSGSRSDRLYNKAAPPLTLLTVSLATGNGMLGLMRSNGSGGPAFGCGAWYGSIGGGVGVFRTTGGIVELIPPEFFFDSRYIPVVTILSIGPTTSRLFSGPLGTRGIQKQTTSTPSGGFYYEHGDIYRCLSVGGNFNSYAPNTLLAAIFDLELTSDSLADSLISNPWQIFRPQVRRSFFDMGAGGGSTLNGSASGSDVASGSASLSAQVALASVGVSTASGSAALAASVPLSAVGLAVAAGSATPSATVTISAAGLAQAAGQAGLSASVLAQAAGAALASGNATLAAQLNALATGAAQAGGSANLSGGAAGSLSASGAAIAAGTAVLSVTVGLLAAGSALASGTATGSANAPGQVSATGGAAAGGSGVMSAQVSITAAGFVQAMGQGAFSATVPLSAFGAVTASGYAHLTVDNGVVMVRAPSGYRTSLIAYNSTRPRQSITIRPISLNTRR